MAILDYRPSKPVHHYCSYNGFKGILESKSLWFSDLTMTNDPRELSYGQDELIQAFKYVRHTTDMKGMGLVLSIFCGHCISVFSNMQFFSCCFTMSYDDRVMWREYAEKGKGLIISFRPSALFDIHARLQKVKYVNGKIQQIFHDFAQSIASEILEGSFEIDGENKEYLYDKMVNSAAKITELKHASWKNEQEIRIVHTIPLAFTDRMKHIDEIQADFLDEATFKNDISIKVRSQGTDKVEYIPLPFGKYRRGDMDASGSVESITIGPNCDLTENEIDRLLKDNGYVNYKIYKSECLFRN